ncbi:MAG: MBL fold metallo-hydrolase, partial [Candidatus Rokuibacteriota bacterium]
MIQFGEVSITPIVEIGRSSFPTTSMLPESRAEVVAAHYSWLKPHFFDEATGDLASRIQTYIVRTPTSTIVIDTGVGNDKQRTG